MLDQTDKLILQELSKNSRITMKELGERVHLTGQATAIRVAKLEDNGVIEAYSIKINQTKLDCYVHAFITIFVKETRHKHYLSFIEQQDRFVLNQYKISGEGCYLVECRFPSNVMMDEFLMDLNQHANYKVSIVINKITSNHI